MPRNTRVPEKIEDKGMNKILIILRHAHRDKDLGAAVDNGLSEKGKKQALAAAEFFLARFGADQKALLLSSPKKRCQQTLAPLAKRLDLDIQVLPCLNEAQRAAQLDQNIDEFRYFWDQSSEPIVVICSHGDWIPRYLERVTGVATQLSKGAWAQLERDEWHQKPQLTWLIQSF